MNELYASIKTVKPVFKNAVFNIMDFGGVCKKGFSNTDAFKNAIASCSGSGGGKIIIPGGIWETGPIHLQSNVNIHLEEGAVISFSRNFEDYLPVVFARWEGVECFNYSPLLYAYNCENIAVTGKGRLEGNGDAWWHWKKLQHDAARRLYHAEHEGISVKDRIFGNADDALRPYFVQIIGCRNVLFDGITLIDGPMWTISPVYCDNAVFSNLTLKTHGPNTDGINPESSRNVLIENCHIDTGDDCIAINSGMNEDGRRVNRQCENIIIRNCTMVRGHGGVAIGSAVSGGIKNVFVHDCRITGGDRGLRFKTIAGRGGYAKNIFFENIEISNQNIYGIHITTSYDASSAVSVTDMLSDFDNIHFKNIHGINNKEAVFINGTKENFVKNVTMDDIDIEGHSGINCGFIDGLTFNKVKISVIDKQSAVFDNVLNFKSNNFTVNKK